jgi:LDH2 family malate/lactate/ureidoglycolate dehydrogenase
MSEISVHVPVNKLVDFMVDACVAMSIPRDDAEIIADVLITSDLWGVRSHGIAHLKMYHERIKSGLQLPITNWQIVKDTPTTAVMDGGNGMGMVVGYNAMKLAIQKAKQYGLGAVAVRNSSHYGVAGYYPLMAVKEGLVGLSVTNAHPSIASTFGVKPMLGTNPIAVAAPTDEPFPFMFDAATSVAPRGKIEIAARVNKPIPEGWVIGQQRDDQTNERRSGGTAARRRDGRIDGRPQGLWAGDDGRDFFRRVPEWRVPVGPDGHGRRRQTTVLAHRPLFPGD